MTILVTGATGLLGNNITRMLLRQQHRVRVLARKSASEKPLENLPVDRCYGDVTDAQAVQQACENVRAVIHCAGAVYIGWKGMEQAQSVNVSGTENIAAACQASDLRLIYVSSVNALGVPEKGEVITETSPVGAYIPCPYVTTKMAAEQLIQERATQGLNVTTVNPGFMLGPWDWKPSSGHMILEVTRKFTPMAPAGGCTACDVRDVAAACITALDKGTHGEHYILGGENISYKALWNMICEVTGGKKPLIKLGPVNAWIGNMFADALYQVTGLETDVNSAAIKMGQQFHYYSSEKAQRELGYENRPLKKSILAAWEWFQKNGYVK